MAKKVEDKKKATPKKVEKKTTTKTATPAKKTTSQTSKTLPKEEKPKLKKTPIKKKETKAVEIVKAKKTTPKTTKNLPKTEKAKLKNIPTKKKEIKTTAIIKPKRTTQKPQIKKGTAIKPKKTTFLEEMKNVVVNAISKLIDKEKKETKSAKPTKEKASKISTTIKNSSKKSIEKNEGKELSLKAKREKNEAIAANQQINPAKVKSTPKSEKKVEVETKPLPTVVNLAKLKSVKSILISQPKPELGKSPYIDLAAQFKIKLDWRPFTKVQDIKAVEFRKQKIYIEQYTQIIFTSRVSVEQYFRICEELRIKIKEENKYFCLNEAIALYLQKFIQYRKRKVFFGDGKMPKFIENILKHNEDNSILLPCSDIRDKALAETLTKNNIKYTEAVIYQTVASDLSDLSDVKYDMLVFFNPSAIDSLYSNFPNFKQDETRLAIFGHSTAEAVKIHNLTINIFSPTPENPSLVDAIKKYITIANKK